MPIARFALAIAAILPAAATAHEFTVTYIIAETAQPQARAAFLLASSERDGHAGETSEGHLGGLDSQLELVTPGMPVPESDIVVAIAPATLPADTGTAWAFALDKVFPRARTEFLDDADFPTRYQARYGTPPDDSARLVYVSARLIDIAVRAQGGTADRSALQQAISGY